jgi:BASS family bile acid:Na+ symporter
MGNSVFLSVMLPVALGIIMLGLGLTLTKEDFTRVFKYPKAIILGLGCQMLVLPFICYGIIRGFDMEAQLAVGMMILAASPGGPTANLFSHLSKGDVALNITLTAFNSILSLFTMPFIVNTSIDLFMTDDSLYVPMQFRKIAEVFAIVLIPVIIGMVIRNKNEGFAKRMDKPVRIASALLLVLVILAAILKDKDKISGYFQQVGLVALIFNVASILIGYFLPRLFRIPSRQATAIGMEIGIHNGTMAIFIAMNVLGNNTMSISPAIYSLVMFITAAMFGTWANTRNSIQEKMDYI